MAKIKEASSFDGTSWSAAIPIGADDTNVDITTATTDPGGDAVPGVVDDTSTSLDSAAVTVSSTNNDTDATAWTKFNRFRARVKNALANLSVIAIQDDTPTQGEKLWLDTSGDGYQIPQINDNIVSRTDTWSSHKISAVGIAVQDEEPLEDSKVWIDTDETTAVTIPEMSDLDTKVSKSGDTMTGTLEIDSAGSGNYFVLTATDADTSVNPQSAAAYNTMRFEDKNGKPFGFIRARQFTDGKRGIWLYGSNDSGAGNSLGLYIDNNGNRDVTISDQAAWRTALGLNGLTADTYIVANNGSVAISMPSATSAFLIFSGAGPNGVGTYVAYTNTLGSTGLTLVGGNNTGITPTYTTNKITIANSTGYVRYILVLRY